MEAIQGLPKLLNYTDLYARCNVDDKGTMPKSDPLCWSPDIIPYGNVSVSDPTKTFKGNWSQDVGKNLIENKPNFIYVRAKNLSSKNIKGKVYLYYTQASLLLYPGDWKNIETSSGKDYVDFDNALSGDIVVTNDPFNWIALPTPEKTHWCLLSRIVTEDHPNPIPTISRIEDFARYIANTGGISQRNVTIVNTDTPSYTVPVEYNQGTEGHLMHFGLCCTNVPVGIDVEFTCGSPGPEVPLYMPKTRITSTQPQTFLIDVNIPANFETKIYYSIWRNGKTIPEGAKIELKSYVDVPKESDLFSLATPLSEVGLIKTGNQIPKEQVGPTYVINVGTHSMVFKKEGFLPE